MKLLALMLECAKLALIYIWWAPSWWLTRLVVWRYPTSDWAKTTSLMYMAICATPLFKQLNACLWICIAIEVALLVQICTNLIN